MNKKLFTANGEYIDDISNQCYNAPNMHIEHFNNINVVNDGECLKYCGEPNKFLCMKPFIHFHEEVVDGKIVRTQHSPSCGHCVSNPDVYFVDAKIFYLILNSTPFGFFNQ